MGITVHSFRHLSNGESLNSHEIDYMPVVRAERIEGILKPVKALITSHHIALRNTLRSDVKIERDCRMSPVLWD